MKALVIDDAPVVRTKVAEILREISDDIDVVEAGDSAEGFVSLRLVEPELVILDIHLPGLNGIQMLPRILAAPKVPTVIVLTNDPTEHHREQCLALGARFFFDKSLDIDRLFDVVADLVRSEAANRR